MKSRHVQWCAVVMLSAFTLLGGERRRAVRHPRPPTVAIYTQGGYADAISVVQGGALTLRIATKISPFTAEVIDPVTKAVIATLPDLHSTPQDCTARFDVGCDWEATTTLDIPPSWPSGHYAVRFPTEFGTQNIFFVVIPANPGAFSKTLLITATNTYEAYNLFGGKNVYPSTSPDRSPVVSFNRPFHDYNGLGRFAIWDAPFIRWMQSEGRKYEVATDAELEDPTFLNHYDLVVIVGHSEYWTRTARENLERYSASGRHLAILGGNTMWWQVRLKDNGRTMVVYKDASLDPESNPKLVTVNWYDEPVLDPENSILGASFRHGGYANTDPKLPLVGYTIANAEHWAFAGANVTRGQGFGTLAAGGETDGVIYNCDADGFPDAVDGSDATPLNYEILATVPAATGFGSVGLYTNSAGGVVFNAGTQDWVRALETDNVVRTITHNVMERLSSGEPQLYRDIQTTTRAREKFNCTKDRSDVLLGWHGEESNARITQRCAAEGPRGLELGGGGARVLIGRNFAPRGEAWSDVELQFLIDVTNAIKTDGTVGLVTLQSRVNDVNTRRARIELQVTSNTKQIRAALYAPDGVNSTKGEWVQLSPGWHSVQLAWSSPGAAVMRVDNGALLSVVNANAGLTANEVSIFYPESEAPEGVTCMDNIAVNATQK